MKTCFNQFKEERGSVLVVAIFTLFFLTMIGLAANTTTEIELQIAGNQKMHKIAFYAAESGIETARSALNDLKEEDVGTWDSILAGNAFTWQGQNVTGLDGVIDTAGGRNVGLASFSLEVEDNDDLDGNLLVDTDDSVIVTSTGSYKGAQVKIEARVRYIGGGSDYAQEHYDAQSTGKASREDNAVAQNRRW